MEDLEEKILHRIENAKEPINTLTFASEMAVDHQKIVGAMKSIECHGSIINSEPSLVVSWELTKEGNEIAENGSHEYRVFQTVPESGIAQTQVLSSFANAKIGISKALAQKWIRLEKGNPPMLFRNVESVVDATGATLKRIGAGDSESTSDADKKDLKKRKLIQESKVTTFNMTKGESFTTKLVKPETELTAEMIATGSWKTTKFKPYNLNALGVPPQSGYLHPLLKVRAEYRQIFLEMGFSEMATNNFVESSFWNFDALFQPQQHPARDAHDTFFLSDPAVCSKFPEDYLERVKKVHSEGGHGSLGYKYDWERQEAAKNVLRTHTTAVSARMLYAIGQQKEFKPVRLFSMDRVFRNETLDATHLAEFHQIEGVVADRGLNLGHLTGLVTEFFNKLGITELRFKPTYNPYTEPSMEVYSYHPGLKKWVELGNSGIFRPEMLLPMGIPSDVNVVAWGFGLERPTMIKYGIDNIRDLVGNKVNLQVIHDNPICRM